MARVLNLVFAVLFVSACVCTSVLSAGVRPRACVTGLVSHQTFSEKSHTRLPSRTVHSWIHTENDVESSPITIDGSHSLPQAFDYSQPHSVVWTDTVARNVISTSLKFTHVFAPGVTHLELSVTDAECNVHAALVAVHATPTRAQGMYCYHYRNRRTPVENAPTSFPRPTFGGELSQVLINNNLIPFQNRLFVAHCFFSVSQDAPGASTTITANADGSGYILLSKGGRQILDSRTSAETTNVLNAGFNDFEFVYVYETTTVFPSARLLFNGVPLPTSRLSYDRTEVLPILTAAFPSSARPGSQSRVRLAGTGLYAPLTAFFSKTQAEVLSVDASGMEVAVRAPIFKDQASVSVQIRSSRGVMSNRVQFSFIQSQCDGPAFEPTRLFVQKSSGQTDVDFLGNPTCVALGPDRRLYIGTATGTVGVLGYNALTFQATTYCVSQPIRDAAFRSDAGVVASRRILGIAFNPSEDGSMLYVSTSTSEFWSNNLISRSNPAAWRNAAIDRMRISKDPGAFPISENGPNNEECVVYDKRIISGLPTANGGAHSINALQFKPNGDLLIAAGGTTNMGLPGVVMGNMWESPLSGALLIARLSKGSAFNGEIQYEDGGRPYSAKKVAGDVEVYASGMRNMFAITMTLQGAVYGLDQGPACKLGGVAIGCDDFDAQMAATWDLDSEVDWPSRVPGDESICRGLTREDKVLRLIQGKFYGHPNIRREQCAWIDPLTGRTADGKNAPANYQGPLTMLPASATSVHEYGASHFCGALRGDLITSTFLGVETWRVPIRSGAGSSKPVQLALTGGLSFAEDIHGNLIFPRFSKKAVGVLRPLSKSPSQSMVVIGVWPRWHRASGGSTLAIGGYNFMKNSEVLVGSARCTDVNVDASGRELTCTMPSRNAAGGGLVDVTVAANGQQSSLKEAVAFMN